MCTAFCFSVARCRACVLAWIQQVHKRRRGSCGSCFPAALPETGLLVVLELLDASHVACPFVSRRFREWHPDKREAAPWRIFVA